MPHVHATNNHFIRQLNSCSNKSWCGTQLKSLLMCLFGCLRLLLNINLLLLGVCVFVCFIEHSEHMKESQTNRNTYPFYVLVQCFIEMWQTLTFTFGAKRRFFAVEPRHKWSKQRENNMSSLKSAWNGMCVQCEQRHCNISNIDAWWHCKQFRLF